MRRAAALILSCALASCGPQQDESAPIYTFISHDGVRRLVVNEQKSSFYFIGAGDEVGRTGDIGGELKSCNSPSYRCLRMATMMIAVPKDLGEKNEWAIEGYRFRVLAHLKGDAGSVLVASDLQGDVYSYFTYSPNRGVEAISFGEDGAPPGLVSTYFLEGRVGMLSR